MRLIARLLWSVLKLGGLAAAIGHLLSRLLSKDRIPPPPRGVDFLSCKPGSGDRCEKTIGTSGGMIELHGHVLEVPAGAVQQNTRFTLHELPTHEVTVLVIAAGHFRGTVNLTLSYARCPASVPESSLTIWRFRPHDGWQDCHGKVNPRARTITAENTKISRFAVGTH